MRILIASLFCCLATLANAQTAGLTTVVTAPGGKTFVYSGDQLIEIGRNIRFDNGLVISNGQVAKKPPVEPGKPRCRWPCNVAVVMDPSPGLSKPPGEPIPIIPPPPKKPICKGPFCPYPEMGPQLLPGGIGLPDGTSMTFTKTLAKGDGFIVYSVK
ncbi:hypothetical protein [Undibacter mobilis]|uniref:hypothetical protein n=1 Tax=Undibacter mobilis TaxID=2292256 RepID=UPI00143D2C64|nr:hypothetical protein [Undibacter mobilis]